MDIQGKHVVVTGGSRGIGEAIAKRCADEGARLSLVARQEQPLKQAATGMGATPFPCDLADREAVRGLIPQIEAENGPVDILVNNAGVDLAGPFVSAEEGDLEQIYRVNLLSPVILCRQVLPGMLGRGTGHIVNISSLAGTAVFPGLVPYSSTKAGLSHFTAGLRADLKGLAIGTTLVELGPIPTDMLANVDSYRPTDRSFRRFYRLRLLVDVDRSVVADTVVDAVKRNRRHVRHPKRAIVFPLLAEAPRRTVELLLAGVKPRVP
jgi:short-subunit dehydrogenase